MKKLLIILTILLFPSFAWTYTSVNGDINDNAAAFLNYMEYLTGKAGSVRKMMVGQHVQDNDAAIDWEDCASSGRWCQHIVEGIYDVTGEWLCGYGGSYITGSVDTNARMITEWNKGSTYAYFTWRPHNPFDADCSDLYSSGSSDASSCDTDPGACCSYTGGSADDYGNFDLDNLRVDDGKAPYDKWQAEKQRIRDALQVLENAGVTVIFRPLQEANAATFWWGNRGTTTPAEYKALVEDMYDYLITDSNLDNVIFAYGPVNFWGPTSSPSYRASWWQWMPSTNKFDIMAPSAYSNTLEVTDTGGDWWAIIDVSGGGWTNEGGDVYSLTSGHVDYIRDNADDEWTDEKSTCPGDLVDNEDWCWKFDTSTGGSVYVHSTSGSPAGTIDVKYAWGGATTFANMAAIGKPFMIGETGKSDVTYNVYSTWLPLVEGAAIDIPLAHFWSGGWRIENYVDYDDFIADEYIINMDELVPETPTVSAPAQGASGILTYPTITGSTFYGPRKHTQTTYQVDAVSENDTDCSGADFYDAECNGCDINVATANELTTKSTWPSQLSDNAFYCARMKYAITVDGSATWGEWSENTIDSQYDGNYFTTGEGGGDPGLSGKTIGLGGSNTVSLGGSKTLELVSE